MGVGSQHFSTYFLLTVKGVEMTKKTKPIHEIAHNTAETGQEMVKSVQSEQEFSFPEYGLTIRAHSMSEAKRLLSLQMQKEVK